MEILHEQLLQRWEQVFGDLESLPRYKTQVVTTQYAAGSRYDLEKFDWDFFPGNGPMTKDKDDIVSIALHEYGFNALHRSMDFLWYSQKERNKGPLKHQIYYEQAKNHTIYQ
jgi:hypothetical protein